jgi:transcription initiation factor IIF auxiliary subunit
VPRLRSWFAGVPALVRATIVWAAMLLAGPIFISVQAMAQTAGSLDVQNVAERMADNQWKWTAFVTGPPEQIAKIQCVRYTLHPTFTNPVQEVCDMSDPKHPFALSAVGWGVFNLRARIAFKDGSSSDLTHFLKF